jgi:hypothetical protein
MVLELGFLAPERIKSFPCVRNCLTLFRPFRTPFAPRHTRNLVLVSQGVPG